MDRGPILPVPIGIRPVLSKYRIEVKGYFLHASKHHAIKALYFKVNTNNMNKFFGRFYSGA